MSAAAWPASTTPSAARTSRLAYVLGDLGELRLDTVQLLRAAGFAVATVAADDTPAIDAACADQPDVGVVLVRERDDPAAAIEAAALRLPKAPIVLVMHAGARGATFRRALRHGATGIVSADRLVDTLVPTVRAVAAGLLVVPPSVRRQLAPAALSHRERQVLGLVVKGYTNRQIADALFVAESTVKTHLSSAFGKLDTRSRAEAAALVMDPEEGMALGIPIGAPGSEDPPGAFR